ncbi:MAG: hypothetical protein V4480_04410 [Patescibacteria group bacterium]
MNMSPRQQVQLLIGWIIITSIALATALWLGLFFSLPKETGFVLAVIASGLVGIAGLAHVGANAFIRQLGKGLVPDRA